MAIATELPSDRCRLCGAASFETVYRAVPPLGRVVPSRFDVCRCGACGLLQTVPMPTAEELRETYEAASYTWQERRDAVGSLEFLYRQVLVRSDQLRVLRHASELAGGAETLDVGCGDALLVAEARRAGLKAYGVDYPGTPRCSICDGAWKQNAALESMRQPQDRWDVVSMFHVLEHLRDPVAVLRQLRVSLRPRGVLVVQVPNFASVQARVFGARWYGIDVPRHLLHFTPDSLRRLLSVGGFEVERVRQISWRDNGPLLASSLLLGFDPRIERERALRRSALSALARRLLYFAVTWGATPLVLLESALGRGATITAVARKTDE